MTESFARFRLYHQRLHVFLLIATLLPLLAAADPSPLFPIRAGRQFGFIDKTGKVVIPPKYDKVEDFHEGLAIFYSGSQAGFLDATGKIVIPAQYTTATDFEHGRSLVSRDGKYSIIDTQGKTVSDIPYRVLGGFSAGLAVLQRPRNGTTPSAYGYIDRDGKIVIQPQFMPAGQFPEDGTGLAVGGLDRHWCYFDRTGKIILRLPMEGHDRSFPFRDGLIRWKEGFSWGFKDATGAWAIPPQYNDANDFKDGLASVELKGKWIQIDTKGRRVEPVKGPRQIRPFSDGLALAEDGDLTGYLKPNGKPAFEFRKYQQAFDYQCGLARIKLDGRFGYLDKNGQLAISNQFHGASDFKNCLASVLTTEGWAYIDTSGKTVWKSESKF